jgi:hypothetical protein
MNEGWERVTSTRPRNAALRMDNKEEEEEEEGEGEALHTSRHTDTTLDRWDESTGVD